MATETGSNPVATVAGVAGVKVPSPFPRKIETVSSSLFATTRSRFASLFRRPMATELGKFPVMMVAGVAGVKVPSPFPRRTETVSSNSFETTRSTFPSLFRSPMATKLGISPVGTVAGVAGVKETCACACDGSQNSRNNPRVSAPK